MKRMGNSPRPRRETTVRTRIGFAKRWDLWHAVSTSMKGILSAATVVWCCVGLLCPGRLDGASPSGDLLAGYHFVGADHWSDATNGTILREIVDLPQSGALGHYLVERLAQYPARPVFGGYPGDPGERRSSAAPTVARGSGEARVVPGGAPGRRWRTGLAVRYRASLGSRFDLGPEPDGLQKLWVLAHP
jgi:hypothetical protein